MIDYEVLGIHQSDDELTYFALFSDCDHVTFEDVIDEKWRKATDEEIVVIERNNTWDLVELPKGKKTIVVKWVYKTKIRENDEIDKYRHA